VKFDKKIDDLLTKGKISPDEAVLLKRSLHENLVKAQEIKFHSQFSYKYMVVGIVSNVILGACWMYLTKDPTAAQTIADVAPSNTIQNVSEILNQSGKVGEMNKSFSTLISIVLISLPVLGTLVWFALSHNGLVSKEEDVLASWAQVESNYQRRADLIPNLVSTVKAFTEHENETQTDVARMRAQLAAVTQENAKVAEMSKDAVTHLNDDAYMETLARAQQSLGGQVKGLMLTVEAYPALRASDQYLELQAQLEGTENRINVARMAFNEKVGEFNASIRKMPASLVAGIGNFQRKAYFKSDEGAHKATQVDFSKKMPEPEAEIEPEIETEEGTAAPMNKAE